MEGMVAPNNPLLGTMAHYHMANGQVDVEVAEHRTQVRQVICFALHLCLVEYLQLVCRSEIVAVGKLCRF